jgi:hypothetical protein
VPTVSGVFDWWVQRLTTGVWGEEIEPSLPRIASSAPPAATMEVVYPQPVLLPQLLHV